MSEPQPSPIPIRVEPLSYGVPALRRPGLVTAIGVLSVVFGTLGLLGSGASVVWTLAMGTLRGGAKAVVVATAAGPTTIPAVYSTNAAGGGAAASGNIIMASPTPAATATADGLATLEPISARQREQFLSLLGERGDWVIGGPGDADPWTPADAAKLVRSHGRLDPAPDDPSPAYYFTLADGRLELHDTQAIYHPIGMPPIVVVATTQPGGATMVTTTQSGSRSVRYGGAGMPGAAAMPAFNFGRGTWAMSLASELLNLALAIFLLVIGIMTLRGSLAGRKLHLIYAMIKLPVVAVGAIAGAIMMASMMPATPGPSAPVFRNFIILFAAIGAAFPAAYPISLLIALQARSVKDWFAPQRASSDLPASQRPY